MARKKFTAAEKRAYWSGYGLGVLDSIRGGVSSNLSVLKNHIGDEKVGASAEAGYVKARTTKQHNHMKTYGLKF